MKDSPPIKVFDDFICPQYQDYLQDFFQKLPYLYTKGIDYVQETTPVEVKNNNKSGFVNCSLNTFNKDPIYGTFKEDKEAVHLLLPMIYTAINAYAPNVDVKQLIRLRTVLYLKNQYEGCGLPHRDLYYPHYTMIYYANDSDGPTCFFDKNMEVFKEVHPKKGRAVIFPGATYHGGCAPKEHDERILLNCNFMI